MKKTFPFILSVLALAVASPVTRAADEDKPVVKQDKKELRIISGPDHRTIVHRIDATEKESVTFLGVETSPVSATLTAQLGLQEGAGLVVGHVVPDSPATGALKQHDILLKLDDQMLIEQHQLAVLIRSHKEGDEITLTYVRGGKQATTKVKLARHEVSKLSLDLGSLGEGFGAFALANGGIGSRAGSAAASLSGDDVNRLLGMIKGGVAVPGMQRMNILHPNGEGDRNVTVTINTGNSHVNLDDDQGSLELSIADGKKQLVARNKKGDEIFSGPIDTPEQRKALPDDVRSRLEKLEDSTQFSYKAGSDFKAETKVVHPRGQGIAVPFLRPASARPAQSF